MDNGESTTGRARRLKVAPERGPYTKWPTAVTVSVHDGISLNGSLDRLQLPPLLTRGACRIVLMEEWKQAAQRGLLAVRLTIESSGGRKVLRQFHNRHK